MPPNLKNVTAIDAGWEHSLALITDGTMQARGSNDYGQCLVPDNLSSVKVIAASGRFCMALREDGTVVTWGDTLMRVPPGIENIHAIAAAVLDITVCKKFLSRQGF